MTSNKLYSSFSIESLIATPPRLSIYPSIHPAPSTFNLLRPNTADDLLLMTGNRDVTPSEHVFYKDNKERVKDSEFGNENVLEVDDLADHHTDEDPRVVDLSSTNRNRERETEVTSSRDVYPGECEDDESEDEKEEDKDGKKCIFSIPIFYKKNLLFGYKCVLFNALKTVGNTRIFESAKKNTVHIVLRKHVFEIF